MIKQLFYNIIQINLNKDVINMRIVEQLEFNDKRIEKYTYVEIKTKDNSEYRGYLNFYKQKFWHGILGI